eukprot:gnl/Chilomastix_cuspidata/3303.p1 GENE.gnl/Chilomastix_cuspidata/3303~~gnl/Chilomastix_cuspidata/3303.p1  ORF type:complete len:1005 (+),score=76.32 gnl/Chilomastix_cuspidata/3303:227-3016(+)
MNLASLNNFSSLGLKSSKITTASGALSQRLNTARSLNEKPQIEHHNFPTPLKKPALPPKTLIFNRILTPKEQFQLPVSPLSPTARSSPAPSRNPGHPPPSHEDPGIVRTKLERKYHPLCNRLTDFLYISSSFIASDPEKLRENSITHVINLAPAVINPILPNVRTRVYIPRDKADENIEVLFYDAIAFIEIARVSHGRCLVACHKGVSRSAAICIAYLMWATDRSFEEVFTFVKSTRPIISPNLGFLFQLREWDSKRKMYKHNATAARTAPFITLLSHRDLWLPAKRRRKYAEGTVVDKRFQGMFEIQPRSFMYSVRPYSSLDPGLLVCHQLKNSKEKHGLQMLHKFLDPRFIWVVRTPHLGVFVWEGSQVVDIFGRESTRLLQSAAMTYIAELQRFEQERIWSLYLDQNLVQAACDLVDEADALFRAGQLPDIQAPGTLKNFKTKRLSNDRFTFERFSTLRESGDEGLHASVDESFEITNESFLSDHVSDAVFHSEGERRDDPDSLMDTSHEHKLAATAHDVLSGLNVRSTEVSSVSAQDHPFSESSDFSMSSEIAKPFQKRLNESTLQSSKSFVSLPCDAAQSPIMRETGTERRLSVITKNSGVSKAKQDFEDFHLAATAFPLLIDLVKSEVNSPQSRGGEEVVNDLGADISPRVIHSSTNSFLFQNPFVLRRRILNARHILTAAIFLLGQLGAWDDVTIRRAGKIPWADSNSSLSQLFTSPLASFQSLLELSHAVRAQTACAPRPENDPDIALLSETLRSLEKLRPFASVDGIPSDLFSAFTISPRANVAPSRFMYKRLLLERKSSLFKGILQHVGANTLITVPPPPARGRPSLFRATGSPGAPAFELLGSPDDDDLESDALFFLVAPTDQLFYLWVGAAADETPSERLEIAERFRNSSDARKHFKCITVKEGNEEDAFWDVFDEA